MNPKRFRSESILIFLMAITWAASDAMAQTDFHSLAVFNEATIVSVRQDGCDLLVLVASADEHHGFNVFGIDSTQPTKLVKLDLSHFDTCNDYQLIQDAKGSSVPDSYRFAPSFDSAEVQGTVEMQCDPMQGPPCEPFSVDINLTWTGFGDITRINAGVVGGGAHAGNIIVCPSNFIGKLTDAGSARSAQVTGNIDSKGTNLLLGTTQLSAFLFKGNEIKLQLFPNGEAGPPFCLCTTPDCQ